ncbi:MAG: hypothetical protein WCF84_26575 [Anaerolineae bacterium]
MSKFLVWVISLLCFVGCSGVTSIVPAQSTVTPAPLPTITTVVPSTAPSTAAAPTAVDLAALFNPISTLLKTYNPANSDPAPLHDALVQAVIQFLTATANADTPLPGQPALDALAQALTALKLPNQVKPDLAAVHLRDSEGGSEDILLISLENMQGLPIVALHRLGLSWQVLDLGGIAALQGAQGGASAFTSGSVQGADLTRDGVGELLYTYNIPGASAMNQELHIMRWDEDAQKLKLIFQATLVSWAGESKYALVPAGKAQNLQLTYPWFGVFDHKLVPHPQATAVWAYDSAKDQLTKQSETVEPAKTVRQQLNVAEQLFRQGTLDRAAAEYDRAWQDKTLTDEPDFGGAPAATRAFARFREGQMLALLGRTTDAQPVLADAQKAGGDLGKLAAAFLKSYTGSDAVIRAWAALPAAVDLYKTFYQNQTNLNFPANASDILYQGEIVAAYLDAHPTAGAQLADGLHSLNFKPANVVSTDLDGDGQPEYLFVTQEGTAENSLQSLWLVYRGPARWLARSILTESSLTLDPNPISLSKGSAIRIQLPANMQPGTRILTWDRTRLIDLDPQTLQPLAPTWPVFGAGNTDPSF